MLILFILLAPSTIAPVLADNIEISQSFYRFPFGNGIDDNNDGVVDDANETDVYQGLLNVSASANTIQDTWATNDSFIYPVGGIPRGVCLGSVYEELWHVNSSKNSSDMPTPISPVQTAKYLQTDMVDNMSFASYTNTICAVMFYINVSPQFIMNGASQLWYRSPLAWDNSTYQGTQHYLNIYDDNDNLVYASPDSDYVGIGGIYSRIPNPKTLVDRSGNYTAAQMTTMTGYFAPHKNISGQSYWNRSYFQLNMNFKSGTRYRFEEYIKTQGNVSINNITIFMARQQDIAGDDETTTYVFYGTSASRNIPVECSWGLVASIGKGRVGSELLLQSNPSYDILHHPIIITHVFSGNTSLLNTGSIRIVLPIRTSIPLNISISYRCWSGASTQPWTGVLNLIGVTSTLVFTINIVDPDITAPNYYQLMFELNDFDTTGNAMTFSVYPDIDPTTAQTRTCMINYGLFDESELYYYAMDIQLSDEVGLLGTTNQGTDSVEYLVGALLIIGAIFLAVTIIGTPVSAVIIAGTFTIGQFTALATAAIGLGTLGTLLIIHSLTGEGLQNFVSWASSGLIRVLQTIYDGVSWFLHSVWDFGVWVAEVIKTIGSALLEYGSIVLNAILQIIWFVAFMIVLMVWGAFLTSMKYIAKGDFDSALSSFFKPIKKPLVYFERKSYAAVKGQTKIQKWSRKVKSQSQK
jgi:hypothetical protein